MANPRKQYLQIETALEKLKEVFKIYDSQLNPGEERLMLLVSESCKQFERDGIVVIGYEDFKGLWSNVQKAIINGDSSFLQQKRGLVVERMVDVEEFCQSFEYMGQKGFVRPKVMEGLIELFHGDSYIECVLTGAIGWGKTFMADMAMGYMLYILSCYHNPQAEFDMAPGSSIIFIQQSKSFNLAKKVVFEQFAERIKSSPYFKENFPFDTNVKAELRFPKGITVLPVGGNDSAALGMNVYGGIIDEMNFMARVKDSSNIQYTHEDEYDQAERLYSTLIRRMKSRFMQKGKLPGKLLLVSSVNYPKDFTSRKIIEARTDKTILTLAHNQWEVLPVDRFCGERFPVEVGNDLKQSRILDNIDEATDQEDVIMVPVEYKTEFERDLEAAMRDLAGITTGTRHPFIPYRENIVTAANDFTARTNGKQLFMLDEVCLNTFIDSEAPDWESIVDLDYIETNVFSMAEVFAGHVDVALSQDCCGLAIGRIVAYKILPTTKFWSERTKNFMEIRDIRAPIYQIDGVLRILPPKGGGEIDLELVRDLMLYVRSCINVKWGTCDSYQSAMMLQAFKKAKMKAGVLSVDTSIAPYTELKLSVKDERILYPQHATLLRELRDVEKDSEKDKVDHPVGGSKDCSDAVAGVVYILQHKEANYGRPSSRSRASRHTASKSVRHIRIGSGGKRVRGRGSVV